VFYSIVGYFVESAGEIHMIDDEVLKLAIIMMIDEFIAEGKQEDSQ